MINIKNEHLYLFINFKAFISFKIKKYLNFIVKGHLIRKNKINKYFNQHTNRKVHFGSNFNLKGYLNSQVQSDIPIDICKKLPFENNSVDLIFSCHVVEHIHYKEFLFFLEESLRVLRKGGVIIITTPSIKKISNILYGTDKEKKNELLERQSKLVKDNFIEKNSAIQINIVMRAFGHRFIYDFDLVKSLAEKIGYQQSILKHDNNLNEYDSQITEYLLGKGQAWGLETESFCLIK